MIDLEQQAYQTTILYDHFWQNLTEIRTHAHTHANTEARACVPHTKSYSKQEMKYFFKITRYLISETAVIRPLPYYIEKIRLEK